MTLDEVKAEFAYQAVNGSTRAAMALEAAIDLVRTAEIANIMLENRAWAIFNSDGSLDHTEIAKLHAELVQRMK